MASKTADNLNSVVRDRSTRFRTVILLNCIILAMSSGCNLFPDVRKQPQYHNPFPQIETVAILPFRNQSEEPTLDTNRVTLGYYDAVQSLPGFEVLPVGLVENQLLAFEQQVLGRPISNTQDLQQFAKHLGVDVVLQGAVTDYDSYYPPRMTLKVNWYAANPGFHPIPAGYGLPWGTKAEKKIPQNIRLEAERALAREQIATQTPVVDSAEIARPISSPTPNGIARPVPALPIRPKVQEQQQNQNDSQEPNSTQDDSQDNTEEQENLLPPKTASKKRRDSNSAKNASIVIPASFDTADSEQLYMSRESVDAKRIQLPKELRNQSEPPNMSSVLASNDLQLVDGSQHSYDSDPYLSDEMNRNHISQASQLPPKWPDPQGFIPAPPQSTRPVASAQSEPIISHMRSYNGSDGDFTQALSDYYYFRDDGRFGGWEAYLQRSEDFIRFCCHQHLVETLAARGGELKSRTVVRWPIDRYER